MKTENRHAPWHAVLIAFFLICVTFPDVIFQGASLRITDQIAGAEHHLPLYSRYGVVSNITTQPAEAKNYFPDHFPLFQRIKSRVKSTELYQLINKTYLDVFYNHQWWDSYTDYGGSLYQSDPMIDFMRYCLWSQNSPYWNPYSAAGQFGPETLVDQKFSVFSLFNAILGGGTFVYNMTLLFFYFLGTYFIYRIAQKQLLISPLGGIAMGVFYLFNGYIVANTSSNVALNYLVIPMCLYASLAFIEAWSALRFIAVLFSFAALLTYTFMPTTIASMIGIYGILIGYAYVLKRRGILINNSQVVIKIGIHLGAVLLAVCLLSFLYLPIFESFNSTGVLQMYSKRTFYAANWQGILSLFSSSHFFESYGAMEEGVFPFIGNVVFHFGIAALCLMACAIGKWKQEKTPLVIICLAVILLVLCRIFGMPGISYIFSIIPIVGNLGCQYWWATIVFPMLFLVGIGVDNLETKRSLRIPLLIIIGIGILAWVGVWRTYGIHEPHIEYKIYSNIMLGIITFAACILVLIACQMKSIRGCKVIAFILTALMFFELVTDGKVLHYQASDVFSQPPSDINFIKSHIGLYRTMTIGNLYGPLHGLRPEMSSAYQIQEITSMNEGGIQNYIRYFHKIFVFGGANPVDPMFPTLLYFEDKPEINKIDWKEINFLGVQYIILPSYFKNYQEVFLKQGLRLVFENATVKIFENPYVLPRAFSINLPKIGDATEVNLPPKYITKLNKTDIVLYRNAEVQLKGYADKPMLVVLTDNWQKGWKAKVNGFSTPIVRVNDTFRGVWVEPGQYIITMYYQPKTLLISMILTTMVLAFILVLLLRRKKVDTYINDKWKI